MNKYVILLSAASLFLASCGTENSADRKIDAKVDSLLKVMTIEEKIGQMVLLSSDWDLTGPSMRSEYIEDIRSGRCGNIFNAYTAEFVRELQRVAVEESRLGIPVLFGYDVIHGHRTIFPISLGESCSWDMEAIKNSARVAAAEAAASGLNWTFAPMCDISTEPRWGRISEGAGEDAWLGSCVAQARVRGFQGDDLSDTLTVLACVKHFAGYGAPQAGRDYNTVDMSERWFREFYLPPYKAAVEAGALSVMTSFNELDGVPATANKHLLQDILRDEWGFAGLVVTDYTSINELVNHGYASDDADAGLKAVHAGVDMDMQGIVYFNYLKDQVENGQVSMKVIDRAVRRILYVKAKLGLFDDPYKYCSPEREAAVTCSPENLEASRDMARKSMVLLKNDGVLPLRAGEKIAVIGELAVSVRDYLGSWKAAGQWDSMTSVLDEIKACNGADNVVYAEGCKKFGEDRSGFRAAEAAAKSADKVVMVIGEDWDWSGEAASRSSINVPGVQSELLSLIASTGKPVVVVLMNGRPLDLSRESEDASAILEAWFPGTMGGAAVADVLFGKYNPSGKLSVTFPRNIGQVPLYYWAKNTGRPVYLPDNKYKSKYIDCPNTPLYPFGYGLSYTEFSYSDIEISSDVLVSGGSLTVSVDVENCGSVSGEEVVQLYVRDLVGSVTRPVRQLKGFRKISLEPGETKTVEFTITPDMLAFYRQDMSFGTEAGEFEVYVGGSSDTLNGVSFSLVD